MSELAPSASQPIIIAGMHRSGTSLTASILQQAGVFIGDHLLPANAGNPQGYFEDADVYQLHKSILADQNIDTDGWTLKQSIAVPEKFHAQAQALCDRRLQQHALWGWKEPRTTLFLEFWGQLLPQAKFIFPYRAPWEVMDSLFMRGDPIFEHSPSFAAEVWLAYNQAILDFYERHCDRCFLFHCSLLKTDETHFVKSIQHKWNLSLSEPNQSLFQPGAMHTLENQAYRQTLLAQYFPATLTLYATLQRVADLPLPQTLATVAPAAAQHTALQDWRLASRRGHQLQHHARAIEVATADLRAKLQATQAALAQAQATADHWRATVQAMEANRAWKMRNAWVRLKQRFASEKPDSP